MTDAGEDRSPIPEPVAPREYLDLCPGCAYRLKGLPMVHTCPECALRYDRRWKVFGGPRGDEVSRRVDRVHIRVMSLGDVLVDAGMVVVVSTVLPGPIWMRVGMGLSALLGFRTCMKRLAHPTGAVGDPFVGVGPVGMCLYTSRAEVEYWDWAQIRKIRSACSSSGIGLETDQGLRKIQLDGACLSTRGACYNYIERALEYQELHRLCGKGARL